MNDFDNTLAPHSNNLLLFPSSQIVKHHSKNTKILMMTFLAKLIRLIKKLKPLYTKKISLENTINTSTTISDYLYQFKKTVAPYNRIITSLDNVPLHQRILFYLLYLLALSSIRFKVSMLLAITNDSSLNR